MEATWNNSSREPATVQIIRMVRDDLNKYQLANFWWGDKQPGSASRYGLAWDSTRGQFLLSEYYCSTQSWEIIDRARSLPDLLQRNFGR
jgi:hypothetical protein